MEETAYRELAENQDKHWWYIARRDILSSVISSLELPDDPDILEIGCGSGGNLGMLRQYGNVTAVEKNRYAREYAREKNQINIIEGSLPDQINLQDKQFDLICLFDVLEHIESDQKAMQRIMGLLNDNGILLLTVPAYQWLYTTHDKILHHFRRYSKKNICKILQEAGLTIKKITYFNTLLFPLVMAARFYDKLLASRHSTGSKTPHKFINLALCTIFRIEKFIIRYINLPFGASILITTSCKK